MDIFKKFLIHSTFQIVKQNLFFYFKKYRSKIEKNLIIRLNISKRLLIEENILM